MIRQFDCLELKESQYDWNKHYPMVVQFLIMFFDVDGAIEYVCNRLHGFRQQSNYQVLIADKYGRIELFYRICELGAYGLRKVMKRIMVKTHPDCNPKYFGQLRCEKTKYLLSIYEWVGKVEEYQKNVEQKKIKNEYNDLNLQLAMNEWIAQKQQENVEKTKLKNLDVVLCLTLANKQWKSLQNVVDFLIILFDYTVYQESMKLICDNIESMKNHLKILNKPFSRKRKKQYKAIINNIWQNGPYMTRLFLESVNLKHIYVQNGKIKKELYREICKWVNAACDYYHSITA